MLDYYQTLGVSRQAQIPEIKKAYKSLALKYHPDRNPNNPVAEEKIKQINEAYTILSDPYKKASYDLLINYHEERHNPTASAPRPKHRRPVPRQERSVYDRYGKYVWNERPQYHEAAPYKIDRSYLKNQLLTLGIVAVLSFVIIGIYQFNQYLDDQKELRIKKENDIVVAKAHALYNQGEYRNAIDMIIALIDKFPIRSRFREEREKMVADLNTQATDMYERGAYQTAAQNLEIVIDYQRPMKLKTWKLAADCYYKLGQYRKAVHAYDYVLIREESNVDLMISIANIYLDHLKNPVKALEYYSEARQTFRQFQVANYGEAYELIIRPEYIPEIYYDMFTKRAELNVQLTKYEDAIKDYNWAIFLRPDVAVNYHFRAMCRFNTNNLNRACTDWNRAVTAGYALSQNMINTHCN